MTSENSSVEVSPRETALAHMVTDIPQATTDMGVDQVIQSLRGQKYDCADSVFVVDTEGRLEGMVRINDLFANNDQWIADIMEPKHATVRPGDDQEQIAVLAIDFSMIAVPVVDAEDKLIGAVPPESLFRILRAEHMEDLQRIAGITAREDGSDNALNEPLWDRFRRRLPWLVFGLLASSIITVIMANFEHTLSANIAVAFFVPALVYIAGAIGTQAVSVAVGGLSRDDVPIIRLLRDELIVGVAIGTSLGLISSLLVHIAFGNSALALVVGLAVLIGGTVSALVGFGLPWTFKRFGSDPALGSGPICTIIQDAVSLSVYVVLAGALIS